ncbi:MAG: hypothetical protein JWM63_3292 [Gammaproteobacteria bacterium]|jgi:hypothetical protein|nr:hypothetical protein [Gammaproteobacteria bacterium]
MRNAEESPIDESGEERPSESLGLREHPDGCHPVLGAAALVLQRGTRGSGFDLLCSRGAVGLEGAHCSDRVGHLHQRGAGQYRLLRGLCRGCRPAAFLTALGVAQAVMVSTDRGTSCSRPRSPIWCPWRCLFRGMATDEPGFASRFSATCTYMSPAETARGIPLSQK